MRPRKARLAGVWLLAAALLAGSQVFAADEAGLERLAAARERWQAAAARDYVYGYHKHCDCYRNTPPETVVTVLDGYIERVYHVHDGDEREVPARDGSLGLYWTIEDLFAKLEGALSGDAIVRVEYDETLGYPKNLFIDYDPGFVGDETDLRLTRVEML